MSTRSLTTRARRGRRPAAAPHWGRRLLLVGAALLLVAVLALVGPALYVYARTDARRYDAVTRVPPAEAAIVFGAGLTASGKPSPLLADRVHAAVQLYQAGVVKRLLLSGDGESAGHDEPGAMAKQARAEGVPATALVEDPAGVRTYDSCARAYKLFGVRSAVVVSQSYHLPRAVYTCRALGIEANGYSFARVAYADDFELRAREVLSLDHAFWQLLGHRLGL